MPDVRHSAKRGERSSNQKRGDEKNKNNNENKRIIASIFLIYCPIMPHSILTIESIQGVSNKTEQPMCPLISIATHNFLFHTLAGFQVTPIFNSPSWLCWSLSIRKFCFLEDQKDFLDILPCHLRNQKSLNVSISGPEKPWQRHLITRPRKPSHPWSS